MTTNMSFPTRTKHHVWGIWIQDPAFTRAANTASTARLPYDSPEYTAISHAALLTLERDAILSSGGFND